MPLLSHCLPNFEPFKRVKLSLDFDSWQSFTPLNKTLVSNSYSLWLALNIAWNHCNHFFFFGNYCNLFLRLNDKLYHLSVRFFFLIIYNIEILLYPNLTIYVCETSFWKFKSQPMPPTPYKHLYLWSDHFDFIIFCIKIWIPS